MTRDLADSISLYGKMLAPILDKTKNELPVVSNLLNHGTAAAIVHLLNKTPQKEAFNFFNPIIDFIRFDTDLSDNQANQAALLLSLKNLDKEEVTTDVRKAKSIRIIEKVWNAHIDGETLTSQIEIIDYKSVVEFKLPTVQNVDADIAA